MLAPLRYLLLPQQGAQRGATHHRDQRGADATRRVSQGAAGRWDEAAACCAMVWCHLGRTQQQIRPATSQGSLQGEGLSPSWGHGPVERARTSPGAGSGTWGVLIAPGDWGGESFSGLEGDWASTQGFDMIFSVFCFHRPP